MGTISEPPPASGMVNLVDMSGRIITTNPVDLEKGINTKDIQLPVQAGIYMLRIRTGKGTRTLPVRVYQVSLVQAAGLLIINTMEFPKN